MTFGCFDQGFGSWLAHQGSLVLRLIPQFHPHLFGNQADKELQEKNKKHKSASLYFHLSLISYWYDWHYEKKTMDVWYRTKAQE